MTADPAYNEWRRVALEGEARAVRRVKAAVATVHYPVKYPLAGGNDFCAWCRHPWPCKTAQVVDVSEVIDDRERIIRAVQGVAEGKPHRELLRPMVMQIVDIIRRGGGA